MTNAEAKSEIDRLTFIISNGAQVLNACCARWNDEQTEGNDYEANTRRAVAQIAINLTEAIT